MDGFGGVGGGRVMDTCTREEVVIPGVVLLLLGEFQSVAEDLDSRLFITVSTCLGRLTVDKEHLPKRAKRAPHRGSHKSYGREEEEGGWGDSVATCVTLESRIYKQTSAERTGNCHNVFVR